MSYKYKIESSDPEGGAGWDIYKHVGRIFKKWKYIGYRSTEEGARIFVLELAGAKAKRIFLDEDGKEDLSW